MNLQLSKLPSDLADLAKEWPMVFMFDLPPEANIVVVGAYEGKVMSLLSWIYPDYDWIHGFEPQLSKFNEAIMRYQFTRNLRFYHYGIGTDKTPSQLRLDDPGTVNASAIHERTDEPNATFYDAKLVLCEPMFKTIDLLVMNVEGYEYNLLPYFHATGIIHRVQRLAVQFHPQYKEQAKHTIPLRMLFDSMEVTHGKPVVDQYPQWVYWKKS